MTQLVPRLWRDPAAAPPPAGFGEKLLAVLYPPRCAFCGSRESGLATCPDCAAVLSGLRAAPPQNAGPDWYPGTVAPWQYEGLARRALLGLKFYDARWRAAEFGRQLCVAAENAIYAAGEKGLPYPQLVTAVPDAPRAAAQKPYAVQQLLAAALARHFGVPLETGLLQKPFETAAQHKLPRSRRLGNLAGAFTVTRPEKLQGKTVWLVDDITTTGSTLMACARVLWLYGAKQVVGCCLCATPPQAAEKDARE